VSDSSNRSNIGRFQLTALESGSSAVAYLIDTQTGRTWRLPAGNPIGWVAIPLAPGISVPPAIENEN
jgi:hypothetical protein